MSEKVVNAESAKRDQNNPQKSPTKNTGKQITPQINIWLIVLVDEETQKLLVYTDYGYGEVNLVKFKETL